ncbi:MAG: universal stress protein [Dyella sp.]
MSAIDLLLHATHFPPGEAVLRVALAAASRLHARLDALYIADLPAAAFSLPEAVPVQLEETRRRCSEAEAYASAWCELLATQSLQGQWRVTQGDSVQSLCLAAAGYQWLIMERKQQRSDAPVGFGNVSRCVFGSRRPVLVVPDSATTATVGKRIVVAWNGSRESALALDAAQPLLRLAEEIVLLDGSPEHKLAVLPPPGLSEWLQRRGIAAHIERVNAGPNQIAGPLLLDAAHQFQADLIVMGAWGRSRLSEMVLGGTTRHLFMHSDLPMLVAN